MDKSRRIFELIIIACLIFSALALAIQGNYIKKHNFIGRCQTCHVRTPRFGTPFEEIEFTGSMDTLCLGCHKLQERTSHPLGVKPSGAIPLARYLDKEGRLTCVTCHDVHKEDKPLKAESDVKGFLRGHVRGRDFCTTCHQEKILGARWRHGLVVSYAHPSGKLSQDENGSTLDQFSVECLSCHDGVISKLGLMEVRSGSYQHGIGNTHPVGVEYPRSGLSNEFVDRMQLPEAVKLFDGKVGCLSCHSLFAGEKGLLVMDNRGSALCISCHKK